MSIIKFIKTESYKKGILYSTIFNVFAKVIALSNTIAIGFFFGACIETDIYFFYLSSFLLFSGMINNVNNSVVIPESMRLKKQESIEHSFRFINLFLSIYLIIGIVFILSFSVFPVELFSIISNYGQSTIRENLQIVIMFMPIGFFMLITTFLTDILTSFKYFTIPMIANMINSVFSVSFIVLFHHHLEVFSIVLGLTIAYAVNFLFLLYIFRSQLKWHYSFCFVKPKTLIWKNLFYSQAGNISSTMAGYFPLYLLSGFQTGIISAINYGQRTADIPNQVIIARFSAVAGIKFNDLFAQKDEKRIRSLFQELSSFLLFIMIPISTLSFIFSKDIIVLLYQRGEFDMSIANNVALFFSVLVLLLPFYCINTLISRLFMASQQIKYSFVYQIVFNIVLLAFIYFGVDRYGAIGYPYALVFMYFINMFFMHFLCRMFFKMINYWNIIKDFLFISFLNLLLAILIHYLQQWFVVSYPIVRLLAYGSLFVFIYLVLNHLLIINKEARNIVRGFVHKVVYRHV